MSLSPKPAIVAACLALAGAGGGAAVLATSAGASTVTTAHTASAHTSDSTGTTGTGTVSITGPKGTTHTRTVPVTCTVVKGHYVVTAGKRHARRGESLRFGVKDYTGAGSYTGTLVITHHRAGSFSGHRYAKVPVTLTSDGGSLKYSKTLSGKKDSALKGKTISVSASWTCSAE